MKIGILTFHFAHNYGAVLQAYALQSYLIDMGHKVEIINYTPSCMKEGYKKSIWWKCVSMKHPWLSISRLYEESKVYKLRKLRWERFNDFINNKLMISKQETINDNYDAYIIGSDQVWNTKITKGFDDIYLCNFPFCKGKRLYISYAASMETTTLTETQKKVLSERLENFDFISVRESVMVSMLQPLTTKHVHQVLDPTMLVNQTMWNEMVGKPIVNMKYILLYRVWGNEAREFAIRIAKERNLEIIELVSWLDYKTNYNIFQAASPTDFITLFKYADVIVTDSFHGTAFSIIFNKDFYFVNVNSSQNRSESLLESLGLQDRIVFKDTCLCLSNSIDYNIVNAKLKMQRMNSISFINQSLSMQN